MNLFIPFLFSVLLCVILVGAKYASMEPQIYWRTILPHTPMPSTIEQLLQPDTGSSKLDAKPIFFSNTQLHDNKTDTVHSKHDVKQILYYDRASTDTQLPDNKPDTGSSKLDTKIIFLYDHASTHTHLHNDPTAALLFLQHDLRRGKQFTLQLADGSSAPKAFIPRSSAESVPFSKAELPTILFRFGIPFGSSQAAAIEQTLSECEAAPMAGEKKLCATSLESMVDFVTTYLGTRDVVALATEGDDSAREMRVYKVGSIQTVAGLGGKGVVSCHPEAFPYAVFFCHATTSRVAYEVEMVVEGGGTGVKVMAVCHTDTVNWNPKHIGFSVLNVKPETVPVCHFLPQYTVVWAVMEKVTDV